MAKKEETKKIVLEREYNIPLRKGFLHAPVWKRTKRTITVIKKFIKRHMKSDGIKIGKYLNMKLWEHGAKNPPHHIKVLLQKDSDGKVLAELVGAPKELQKEEKKGKKKKAEEKKETEKEAKEHKLEEVVEEAKEEKQEKAKEIEKEEIKEIKHEHPHHPPKEPLHEKPLPKEKLIPGR